MSERASERTYSDAEVEERLKNELPHWNLEDGWIRRKYKTAQLERHADGDQHGRPPGRGRLAPPRHHGLLCLGRGAPDEPRRQGHHRQGFRSWRRRSRRSSSGSPARRAARSRGRRRGTSASPTSSTTLSSGLQSDRPPTDAGRGRRIRAFIPMTLSDAEFEAAIARAARLLSASCAPGHRWARRAMLPALSPHSAWREARRRRRPRRRGGRARATRRCCRTPG